MPFHSVTGSNLFPVKLSNTSYVRVQGATMDCMISVSVGVLVAWKADSKLDRKSNSMSRTCLQGSENWHHLGLLLTVNNVQSPQPILTDSLFGLQT